MIFPQEPKIKTYQSFPVRVIWHSTKNLLTRSAQDCVLWTGQKTSNGSGRVTLNKQRINLRRYVYAMYHGELKHGEFVRNTCPNANCLNPAHLEAYTNTIGKDIDLLVQQSAELYRRNLDINQVADAMDLSRSRTERLLKLARDAKLLLPVEAEGLKLTANEIRYFRKLGYSI